MTNQSMLNIIYANSSLFSAMIVLSLGIISPGPDFLMVLKNSVNHSSSAGVYTALGVAFSSVCLFSICILGVDVVMIKFTLIFKIVKISGISYLVYIGVRSIFSKVSNLNIIQVDRMQSIDKDKYFKSGFFCNFSNPKALLFYISVATIISHSHSEYIKLNSFIMFFCAFIIVFVWFMIVAILFGNMRVRNIFLSYQRLINVIFGLFIICVAIKMFYFDLI